LIRASLELRFTGIIPIVIVISIIPALVEGVITAALSRALFGMPVELSYALGFILANVGTGVSLPSVYAIVARGFKIKQEIPNSLILTTTFDNLFTTVVATCFWIIAHNNEANVS
jgi:hypothetical protein